MRATVVLLAIAFMGCSESTSPANPFARATGTYSEYMLDGYFLPTVSSVDTCQIVNTGGWLTLTIDGKYQMMLDNVRRLCNGAYFGGESVPQVGTYEFVSDTVIAFAPAATYGPPFTAVFDAGDYSQESGGRVPQLRFQFVGHDYWLLEEMPSAQARR